MEVSNNVVKADKNVPNPTDMDTFTDDQKSVAFVAKWTNVNSFRAILTMDTWPRVSRFMMFAGPM